MGLHPRPGTIIATSTNEDNEKWTDNMETDTGLEKDYDKWDNGNVTSEEFSCCGKTFGTWRGLRIHQGKVCGKSTQQCRSSGHQTCGQNFQKSTHSRVQPTVEAESRDPDIGEKKPKIKWPKANDTASYKSFDDDVSKIICKLKGDNEQKLKKLAEVVYNEGLSRFGAEVVKTNNNA